METQKISEAFLRIKHYIHIIARELCYISLALFLLLFLAETTKEGFVSYFFSVNILLFIVLGCGILMVLFGTYTGSKPLQTRPIIRRERVFIAMLTLMSSLFLYYKIQHLGGIAFGIAAVFAVFIYLICYLIATDSGHENPEL